jgi:hypothetical protein
MSGDRDANFENIGLVLSFFARSAGVTYDIYNCASAAPSLLVKRKKSFASTSTNPFPRRLAHDIAATTVSAIMVGNNICVATCLFVKNCSLLASVVAASNVEEEARNLQISLCFSFQSVSWHSLLQYGAPHLEHLLKGFLGAEKLLQVAREQDIGRVNVSWSCEHPGPCAWPWSWLCSCP